MKGAARGFGAAEMGEIAARLERDAETGSVEGGAARIAALAMAFERTRAEFADQLAQPGSPAGRGRSIRVLLADDNPDVRGALTELFDTEPSLELIGAAGDADAAIELAAAAHPDVALLDLDMPGGGGWRVVEEIESCCPETQSIVLTAPETAAGRVHAMRSGAADVLPKGASRDDILAAIQTAATRS
jgi:CheY-like chemotaxis protein